MKTAQLKVRPYPKKNPRLFVIDYRVNSKRQRKFFKTKTAAQAALSQVKITKEKEGQDGLNISPDLRVAAFNIQESLKKYGKTLRDAGAFYLKYLEDINRSITVQALVSEYLAMKGNIKPSLSEVHLKDLRNRFNVFCEKHGEDLIRIITQEQIETWLNGRNMSVQSVANYRMRLSSLFDYGIKKKYLDHNVIKDIETSQSPTDPPEILSVDELSSLLSAASPELLPMFVIGAFAGLRTAELLRLDWHEVNLATGFIEVKAKNAKTARRRLIEISPNLQEWLRPYADRTGPVCPFTQDEYHRALTVARKAAGLAEWPNNALRHGFASYHLALHENAAKLSLLMGHATPTMLFTNYRELVTKVEAERYWQIRPAAVAENVVSMVG